MNTAAHTWKFFRYGGIDQVSLETGADLVALKTLDPKLWATLSCSTRNVEFDSRTLELIDQDKDGRIKIPEILAAVNWACAMITDPGELTQGNERLPLTSINTTTTEGQHLLASAKELLKNLGKETADSISLEDVADTQKIFSATLFNGDGIIVPGSTDKEETRSVILEIMDFVGSDLDRSGNPGISEARATKFFSQARAFAAWWGKAEDKASGILPFDETTHAAAQAYKAVREKVEDFFTRSRLAQFDPAFSVAGQCLEKEYAGLLKKALSARSEELREFPLAIGKNPGVLPLTERLNPAWAREMTAFRNLVVNPVIGQLAELDDAGWHKIETLFAPYLRWESEKAGADVEKLGLARIRTILSGTAEKEIAALIVRDAALEPQFTSISSVEKLVRLYRFLFRLLNNFVSLRDFYSGQTKAIFQMGTLFIDGRSCELCVRVDEVGKHSAMSTLCNTYLAYCDCVRHETSERMTIAAAFTAGDADQLMVGRNGIFIDRKGVSWDASIIKIIDHPISIQQAFWSPYRRLGRMIQEQIEKFASSKDKAVHDNLTAGVSEAGKKLETAAPTAQAQAFDVGKFAGIFAAIGLAIGAIGTAIASIVSGFLALSWWQMPLAVAGIFLAVSGPSMLLAAVRLRQRNLGPLLDANGWAVNTRAKINLVFGGTLTRLAELPPGAIRSLEDPFAEKVSPWKTYLALVLIIFGLGYAVSVPEIRSLVKSFLVDLRDGGPKPSGAGTASPSAGIASGTPASLPAVIPGK